ncbi:MAG: ABC transporter ATP-binding protein [Tepidiformaceae bacterium]
MTPDTLTCSGVGVSFGAVQAVDGASLAVRTGEIVTLLGPSGCGKTTLLRCIAGLERASAGEVRVAGVLVESPAHHVPPHRRPVGLVFQDFALFPHLTVAANIAYGLPRGPASRRRGAELLALAGLTGYEGRYPHQLSAGQQQRVAILRSLAPRPRVLLLDEPFSNLDPALHASMREQVGAILRAEGATSLVVTHDRADAFALADRVAVMSEGRILQVSPPEELYFRPASMETAAFGGDVQYVPGIVRDDVVETVLGAHACAGPVSAGPAQVLVRPEWLIPCADGVPAAVEEVHLAGGTSRARLALSPELNLEMTVASGVALTPGPVRIGVRVALPAFAVPNP